MANTVFILGAGASQSAGTPLMNNFLDVAHELLINGTTGEFEDSFKIVFDGISKLQQVHSKSQLNIQNVESVFAAFEMAKTLSKFPEYNSDQINALVSAMKSLIVATIQSTFKIPYSNFSIKAPHPYPEFATLVSKIKSNSHNQQPVAIITFNYDIGLDLSFELAGIPIRYGLKNDERSDFLPLIKLHGSLNWAQCSSCGEIVSWPLSNYMATHTWDQLGKDNRMVQMNIASNMKTFKHGNPLHLVQGEPMIVPPTWNKSQYHASISKVWAFAAQELSEAENIFVIGYSLPESDVFFRLLYALGTVGPIPLNRFWVLNPDKTDEVKTRFSELLGPGAIQRFQYLEYDFTAAVGFISQTFKIK